MVPKSFEGQLPFLSWTISETKRSNGCPSGRFWVKIQYGNLPRILIAVSLLAITLEEFMSPTTTTGYFFVLAFAQSLTILAARSRFSAPPASDPPFVPGGLQVYRHSLVFRATKCTLKSRTSYQSQYALEVPMVLNLVLLGMVRLGKDNSRSHYRQFRILPCSKTLHVAMIAFLLRYFLGNGRNQLWS